MKTTCPKCRGLLVAERHLDFYGPAARWKCILSSNSKCNTTGPDGLRCCHAKTMLHTLEC